MRLRYDVDEHGRRTLVALVAPRDYHYNSALHVAQIRLQEPCSLRCWRALPVRGSEKATVTCCDVLEQIYASSHYSFPRAANNHRCVENLSGSIDAQS